MGAYAGGKRVSDGIQFCFDTQNPKSWPGSGATIFDLGPRGLDVTGFTVTGGYMNANGGTATAPSSNILNNDVHSIFFTVRFDATGTYPNGHDGSWRKIFGYEPSGTDRSPGIWRYPSNRIIHWRYNPANTGTDFDPPGEFNVGQWYYVGVTKNGAATINYIDGVQDSTASVSNPSQAGDSTLRFLPGFRSDMCKLGIFQIWTRVLTAQEIKSNYRKIKRKYGI